MDGPADVLPQVQVRQRIYSLGLIEIQQCTLSWIALWTAVYLGRRPLENERTLSYEGEGVVDALTAPLVAAMAKHRNLQSSFRCIGP